MTDEREPQDDPYEGYDYSLARAAAQAYRRWARHVSVDDIYGIDPEFTGDETATEYIARRRS